MERLLQQLLVVAKSDSLKNAGQALGISQPALTKNMQRLESQYKVPLLERTSRGITLTQFGEIIVNRAKRIEHEHVLLNEELSAVRGGKGAHLRVGCGPVWASNELPDAMVELVKKLPELNLQLDAGSQEDMFHRLGNSELDIVLASDTISARSQGEFDYIPFWDSSVEVYVSPSHPLVDQITVSAHMLSEYSWALLTQSNDVVSVLNQFFHDQELPPANVAFRSAYWESIPNVINETELLLLIPERLATQAQAKGLILLDCEALNWEFSSGVWLRKGIIKTKAQNLFIECLEHHTVNKRN
ncbi:LysR family transcriptional regulator [Vibrio sp. ZSDZ34]|uniref:LysR family transcriptional regulator n=1 Tax=Vibrio gelatinilyticus TaxID=2893468 RepID=A0A9X1WB57_9VIBR|nr:LysR family transcriptional regulator [Vibrio gelatinilyticus]MCJ2377632.1 LysR family transcriptional regulator [Vibrio gelatinilyticus]